MPNFFFVHHFPLSFSFPSFHFCSRAAWLSQTLDVRQLAVPAKPHVLSLGFSEVLISIAMKFSIATLLVVLPLVSHATAATVPLRARQTTNAFRGGFGGNGGFGGFNNGGKGGNNNNNAGKGNTGGKGSTAASSSAAAAAATSVAATSVAASSVAAASTGTTSAAAAAASSSAAAGGDPQTSLTLDPRVIAPGFAQNGQQTPEAGQVASLTSTNNFINFCLTVPNLPITNGQQITTGSCNPAPIGVIPAQSLMPSAKFVSPKNGDNIAGANTEFTITMAINNLQAGNFVNAETNYFAAPQQLNAQGLILGHSHVVVETLSALDQTTPTDPTKFAFFKGLNAAASNGQLTADVTSGLPAGAYRLCSINTSANHLPAVVPVAQHGALDDCVYFTVGGAGAAASSAAAAATSAAAGAANTSAGAAGTSAGAAGTSAAATGAANTSAAAAGAANTSAAAGAAATGAAGTATGAAGGATAKGNTNKGNTNKGNNNQAGNNQNQGGRNGGRRRSL